MGISGGTEAHRGLREQRLNRYPQGPLAAVSEAKRNFERKDVVDKENVDISRFSESWITMTYYEINIGGILKSGSRTRPLID